MIKLAILVIGVAYGQFEYDKFKDFKEVKWCGLKLDAYPLCAADGESPVHIQGTTKLGNWETASGQRMHCHKRLNWYYTPERAFSVEKKEHTIEVLAPEAAKFENPVDLDSTRKHKVKEFCLEQVHFHWHDKEQKNDKGEGWLGSEHMVNKKKWRLEAHFVHYNCERGSVSNVQNLYPDAKAIKKARESGDDVHELGVIAVFFDIKDEANPAIGKILDAEVNIKEQEKKCTQEMKKEPTCRTWTKHELEELHKKYPKYRQDIDSLHQRQTKDADKAKAIQEQKHKILKKEQSGIDLGKILTNEILEEGYYSYEGSLTTPPCTTDVRWFVMKKASYISKAQILRFRQITRPCKDELIAPNWRKIQTTKQPKVYECTGKDDDDKNSKCECKNE